MGRPVRLHSELEKITFINAAACTCPASEETYCKLLQRSSFIDSMFTAYDKPCIDAVLVIGAQAPGLIGGQCCPRSPTIHVHWNVSRTKRLLGHSTAWVQVVSQIVLWLEVVRHGHRPRCQSFSPDEVLQGHRAREIDIFRARQPWSSEVLQLVHNWPVPVRTAAFPTRPAFAEQLCCYPTSDRAASETRARGTTPRARSRARCCIQTDSCADGWAVSQGSTAWGVQVLTTRA